MLLILRQKASQEELSKIAADLSGYIKVVVDIDRNILAAGGERHVDGEQLLLSDGSKQSSLWGGGFETKTREIDYNSMINLRPGDDNPSREILASDIRKKFDTIVKNFLW